MEGGQKGGRPVTTKYRTQKLGISEGARYGGVREFGQSHTASK